MSLTSYKLIFSDFPRNEKLVFNYVDVGARGDIEEPWSLLDKECLRVIGFEPDPDEARRLGEQHPERSYYGTGLWGEKTEGTFYLCEIPEVSSMYPPNQAYNQRYRERHHVKRVPVREIPVNCDAMDNVLREEDTPDFIKIDTQGSEYEIIKGARRILTDNIPMVLTETWCSEIYKGAPLTHDVLRLMFELGYQPADLNVAAAWQAENRDKKEIESKAGLVGIDFLFIKRPEFFKDAERAQLLKFVCLCELYGFRDFALSVLEQATRISDDEKNRVRDLLLLNNEAELSARRPPAPPASRLARWKGRLRRLLGRSDRTPVPDAPGVYPRLHY